MAKYQKNRSGVSDKTQQEALNLTHQVLSPSELKLHRKVVSKGIQAGIDLYKKQQKTKARELDKQLKKVVGQSKQTQDEFITEKPASNRYNWLPWALLVLSWAGFFVYQIVFRNIK